LPFRHGGGHPIQNGHAFIKRSLPQQHRLDYRRAGRGAVTTIVAMFGYTQVAHVGKYAAPG
jgi:hypothetical protein